eukprot:1137909-Pelagomonas_calceolata.AAC.1
MAAHSVQRAGGARLVGLGPAFLRGPWRREVAGKVRLLKNTHTTSVTHVHDSNACLGGGRSEILTANNKSTTAYIGGPRRREVAGKGQLLKLHRPYV